MSDYKHLKMWQHPSNYLGATWEDYYIVLGQHRDSDRITRSNFTVAKQQLEAIEAKHKDWNEDKDEGRMLVNPYESHWAVGHTEWLGVHKDSPAELLAAADAILESIEDYPLLDESHHSELEWNEANEYWEHEPLSCRLDWLKRYIPDVPCFAARHDLSTITHEYNADRLWEALTND